MGLKTTTNCYGYQQVLAAATVTAFRLALPNPYPSNKNTPATYAIIQAEAFALRWRDDGIAPTTTSGMVIPAGGELRYDGDLTNLQLINGAAGAICNYSLYS
jgi:hypothetical protein